MTNIGWLIHRLTHRHKWRYFVDGSICRACDTCPAIQYDLPTGVPSNKGRNWLG